MTWQKLRVFKIIMKSSSSIKHFCIWSSEVSFHLPHCCCCRYCCCCCYCCCSGCCWRCWPHWQQRWWVKEQRTSIQMKTFDWTARSLYHPDYWVGKRRVSFSYFKKIIVVVCKVLWCYKYVLTLVSSKYQCKWSLIPIYLKKEIILKKKMSLCTKFPYSKE